MFRVAARRYLEWQVVVGSHTGEDPVSAGSGCLLSSTHVLTALHVVTDLHQLHKELTVVGVMGTYRVSIIWQNEARDLALLRFVEPFRQNSGELPLDYPRLSNDRPTPGATLGSLSRLRLDRAGERVQTCFSMSSVAFYDRTFDPPRAVLSGGMVQGGFSGSAVFAPDASLEGILVLSFQFSTSVEGQTDTVHTLPMMCPINDVASEISQAMVRQ